MKVDLDGLINSAFNTIEEIIPDAIVQGELVKYEKVYNRETAQYDENVVDRQAVRCVFDDIEESFRISENSNTFISKIHVFGFLEKQVEMFDELQLTMDSGLVTYKTAELTQVNIGKSTALHTFIITR